MVIDELGYLALTTEQINIFFKLIDMRYNKKSTIITTNLDYPQWYDVFKNKELVDAMIDRFKHFCNTIYTKGNSLRAPKEIAHETQVIVSPDTPKLINIKTVNAEASSILDVTSGEKMTKDAR